MSCQEIRVSLDAYIDGELDVTTTLQLESHLSECDSCRRIYERYRQLHDSVRNEIRYFAAPKRLEDRIRGSVRPAGRDQNRSIWGIWFLGWRGWAIAGSVIVLAVFGTLLFQMTGRTAASEMLAEEVVSSHIRSLMANHLSDVISTDQHTVKPWFSGKLDFAPVVKDLSSKGFPLAGGRLDYIDSRPAAALVYKRHQHTINLFLWPTSESNSNPYKATIKGFNILHWTQSHMAYWAVSDLNAEELIEFAHDLEM
ncbi:MAG TPA: anti-sigma factor [Edaphobacter sp.]|nr:anti-sigma factor [Edaphobacter sp.]